MLGQRKRRGGLGAHGVRNPEGKGKGRGKGTGEGTDSRQRGAAGSAER